MKSLDILNRFDPTQSSGAELDAAIEDVFSYHAPDAAGLEGIANIRRAASLFAESIVMNAPPSADRSSAIRHVRNAMMEANAAIVLGNGAEIVRNQ